MKYNKLQQILNYFFKELGELTYDDYISLLLKYNSILIRVRNTPGVYINIDTFRPAYGQKPCINVIHEIEIGQAFIPTKDTVDTFDNSWFKDWDIPAILNTIDWFNNTSKVDRDRQTIGIYHTKSKRSKHRIKPVDQVFLSLGSRLGMEQRLDRIRTCQSFHEKKLKAGLA